MQKTQPVPSFKISTDSEDAQVYETSLVADPATGMDFLAFSKAKANRNAFCFAQLAGAQRMLSGVWFAPDTEYVRQTPEGLIYTVLMDKEALKNAVIKHMKSYHSDNVTVEHGGNWVGNFKTIEVWIYEQEGQRSPIYGHTLEDLGYNPADIKLGTVFKTIWVEDEYFWNDMIVGEKVKGFSIGGLFDLTKVEASAKNYFSTQKQEPTVEKPEEKEAEKPAAPVVADTFSKEIADLKAQMTTLMEGFKSQAAEIEKVKAEKEVAEKALEAQKAETAKAIEEANKKPITPAVKTTPKQEFGNMEKPTVSVVIGGKVEQF